MQFAANTEECWVRGQDLSNPTSRDDFGLDFCLEKQLEHRKEFGAEVQYSSSTKSGYSFRKCDFFGGRSVIPRSHLGLSATEVQLPLLLPLPRRGDWSNGKTILWKECVIFGVKYCISVYYTDWTTTFQEFYSPNPCGAPLRAVVPGVPPRHLQTSPTIEKQQQHTKRKIWPWIITSTISTRMNATCPISGKGPGHMSVAPRWVDECISKSTSRNQPLVPQFQHTLPYILLQSNKTQKSISLIHGLFSKYFKK